MSIRFTCACGKHLRARESLAGKRTVCPACGHLVGVPFKEASQRGAAAEPLTPAERARAGRPAPLDPLAMLVLANGEQAEAPPPRRRSRRHMALEKHWYECLLFPFYAWGAVFLLALLLWMVTALAMAAWMGLNQTDASPPPGWVFALVSVVPVVLVGYVLAFLQCVFYSAAAGETGLVRWPGFDLGAVAWALAAWVGSFLSGPILFAVAAYWFWLYAGDLTTFDWIVLGQLCVVGAAHWLFTLVAVQQGERLRDANPARVADVICRLGYGAVIAMLASVTIGLLAAVGILHALAWFHEESPGAFLLLFACWLGGMAWATFLFRLLGIWCFQSRVEIVESEAPRLAPSPAPAHAPARTLSPIKQAIQKEE